MKFTIPSKNIDKKDAIIIIFLVLSILTVYWKTYESGFIITFDDNNYVYMNEHVKKGLSLESIRWAFQLSEKGEKYYWHPVTWISHMADCQLYGLNPGMHHLSNVFYHVINTVLLFLLFRLMTGAVWKSALVSVFFALHPVNVDSVAWIAERKNLLSTTFWMLTTLSYLYYIKMPSIWRYLPVFLLMGVGLLAKPMLVTIPFVFLLLDYWPLARINLGYPGGEKKVKKAPSSLLSILKERGIYRVSLEKVPLMMLSFASIYISSRSMRSIGSEITTDMVPMSLRIQNAIVSYLAYISKMIWPANLSVYHPFPNSIPLWQLSLSSVILVLISLLAVHYIRRFPYMFVGWFWFVGTLIPVIGIMQGGLWPAYAERWAYVPYIGLFLIISWGGEEFLFRFRVKNAIIVGFAAVVFLFLSCKTWVQTGYWKDDLTLFTHEVAVNPDSAFAHRNLGVTYAHLGMQDRALYHYKEALRIRPYLEDVYYNMGLVYYHLGMINDATYCFKKAIDIKPQFQKPHGSLGEIYYKKGDMRNATFQFNEILKASPDDLPANNRLGIILASIGKTDEAMMHFNKILTIDPKFKDIHNNIGITYFFKGESENAIKEFRKEIQVYPRSIDAYLNLGIAYLNIGKENEAIECYKQASKIDPSSEKAHVLLENALKKRSSSNYEDKDATLSVVRRAIEKDPTNATLHYKLAKLYQGAGEVDKAIKEYQSAVSLMPKYLQAMHNLAVLYSAKRDYDNAMRYLLKISERNPSDPEVYYNIACIYSLQNNVKKSADSLNTAIDRGFHNWELIRNDKDLANMRKSPLYKSILKSKQ